jgi:cyclophilin family peptidyl-prolyl cis-trans isomerase
MIARPLIVFAACLALALPAIVAEAKAATPAEEFATQYAQWKAQVARLAQIKSRYQTDTSADRKALEAEAQRAMDKAREILEPLTVAAAKAYVAAPNQDKELNDFLIGALQGYIVGDDYDVAARIAKILVDNQCPAPQLDVLAGTAFFATNDFDAAGKHLQAAKEKRLLNRQGFHQLQSIDHYKELWKKEQGIRAAEARAGNLPRVKLETNQGDIVVELFENEAPNTTANFVSLVESGFYDGKTFHRVIPGFMAQGGDPNGDGSGGPGYTIPDECRQENHRNHFRGTLSMAKTAEPDSAGSQFFICFAPVDHLDGKYTAFGRVVEGMRVLSKLQRTEGVPGTPGAPDKIIKATVLSKRPHEYKPVKRLDKTG